MPGFSHVDLTSSFLHPSTKFCWNLSSNNPTNKCTRGGNTSLMAEGINTEMEQNICTRPNQWWEERQMLATADCIITKAVISFPWQDTYNENCNFKEVFLENYFNAYSSAKWTKNGKEMFIALSQKGRPMRGKKTRRKHIASHFIPMKCREEERRVDWQQDSNSLWFQPHIIYVNRHM